MLDEYTTTDFWLASFLKAKGLRIIGVRPPAKRAVFVFEDSVLRANLVKDFYNDGQVKIGDIKTAFQDLKSSIFNIKE